MHHERLNIFQAVDVSQQATNKVLRNTYALLAMTLAFSGVVAFAAQQMHVPHPGMLVTLIGFYGLFFLTMKLRNSGWGLLSTFALTGFMGYTLGPVLNRYLGMSNGADIIVSAFSMTAIVFGGLSAYVLTTRKNLSFLSGFLTVGSLVLLGGMLVAWLFELSVLHLAISAGFVLFSSVAILWQTSEIIHGGERNYIMATISLYISIYNLFLSLLQLLGVASRDD